MFEFLEVMSDSSENDDVRLRAGEVGVRESDRPVFDTDSGGEITNEGGEEAEVVDGSGSVEVTGGETEKEVKQEP